MSEDSGIIKQIDLGLAIESFLESDLGKFMLDRAAGEAIEAVDAIKIANPNDADEIRRLQNIIHRAESFEVWLIEGLQQGRAMEQQLELSNAPD